jgi:hypothetical protein
MKEEIETEYTDNIVCPYCGYEDTDSWEHDDDSSEATCSDCGKDFRIEIHRSTTYSSFKIDCTDLSPLQKHKFKLRTKGSIYSSSSISYYNYVGGYDDSNKVYLAEEDWNFQEVYQCENCEETEYRTISREDFISKYKDHYELVCKWSKERR